MTGGRDRFLGFRPADRAAKPEPPLLLAGRLDPLDFGKGMRRRRDLLRIGIPAGAGHFPLAGLAAGRRAQHRGGVGVGMAVCREVAVADVVGDLIRPGHPHFLIKSGVLRAVPAGVLIDQRNPIRAPGVQNHPGVPQGRVIPHRNENIAGLGQQPLLIGDHNPVGRILARHIGIGAGVPHPVGTAVRIAGHTPVHIGRGKIRALRAVRAVQIVVGVVLRAQPGHRVGPGNRPRRADRHRKKRRQQNGGQQKAHFPLHEISPRRKGPGEAFSGSPFSFSIS